MKLTLLTSNSVFEDLHQLSNTQKQTVKIDRDALSRLLIDHSNMVTALGHNRVTIAAPKRDRVRLT